MPPDCVMRRGRLVIVRQGGREYLEGGGRQSLCDAD